MDSNPSTSLDNSRQKMLHNVKELMLGRLIILTLFLTITFLFQVSEEKYFFIPLTNACYYFIGLFYLVTVIYALFLKKVKDLLRFTFIQMVIDHLFITGLIYFTGGKESFFPIAYIFLIIGSTILFYKRGAFFSASLSTILYGLLLLLQLHHWINPLGQSPPYEASQIFYSLITFMAAFYVVAFLSGYIAEELKKKKGELIQKQVDYDQLETFNRNVIQSLDSGLLTINLHGQINFANRTAEKILNRNAEELKKLSIDDLFPNHNEVFNEIKKNTLNSPWDYQRYETVLINHEGKKVYLGFSISPLTAPDGSCIGYTLIFQDITNVKEMEEQVKRSDKLVAIGQLAAGLAHEIRNPLTSLSGSIQMLKSELVLDHPNQRLMDIILRESERLNALITDFLLFAKPPKTNKKLCEIGKILEETIDLFTHSLEYHQNVRIRRLFSDDHIQILIDPDQMKQVFWNLLMNAVQAMVNGGELSIDLKRGNDLMPSAASRRSPKRKSKEWVKIFITDAGNGIDPKDKRKIFDPFFTTKERGTGLGLSIVHKIIENHNGVIKVESEVGKGSTFILFLPVH